MPIKGHHRAPGAHQVKTVERIHEGCWTDLRAQQSCELGRPLRLRVPLQLLPQNRRLRELLQGSSRAIEEGFEIIPFGFGDLTGLLELVEHQGALELLQGHPLAGEQGHQPDGQEGEGETSGD